MIFSEWSGDMRTLDDVNKWLKDKAEGKGNPAEGDDPPFKCLGTYTVTAAKAEDSMTSFGKPGYSMVHNIYGDVPCVLCQGGRKGARALWQPGGQGAATGGLDEAVRDGGGGAVAEGREEGARVSSGGGEG